MIKPAVDMRALDAEGRSLVHRASDLAARKILLRRAEGLYRVGREEASCMLIHAERYLQDRLGYELYPWPRGCVLLEFRGFGPDDGCSDDWEVE